MIIRAIKHEEYSTLLTSIKTQQPPFTYTQVLQKLHLMSDVIESKNKTSNNNTDTRSISKITKINGYEIDEKGNVSSEVWETMNEDQRTQFKEKRKQLRTKNSLPSYQSANNNNNNNNNN